MLDCTEGIAVCTHAHMGMRARTHPRGKREREVGGGEGGGKCVRESTMD